ncbi:polypeptide N-acetylgalactosaminyltransferase 12 isoform X2 [Hyperolius riggenbachi]|uniref:polypeptide N-acetylgalactosaminyltransferase 12 isoform X2 n=1 Tax=Hyperolius riggenbachi TaxID=752182 RepID=UPI0035A31725
MSKRRRGLMTAWQPLRRRKTVCLLAVISCILFFGFLLSSKGAEDKNQLNSDGHESQEHVERRAEPAVENELTDEQLKKPVYERPPLDPGALGEFGRAVKLELQGEEKKLEEESINKHQINIYLSDKISLHRRLEERWNPMCGKVKYDYRRLPTTSVVIAFYNEAWSTLLRTVHSILYSSPDILLEEIILVDDYSEKEHLKAPLQEYVSTLKKVRLVRATKREGLVRARLLGASKATGEVLTFLDCHCECHDGWLEPLMERIREKETAVVCPVIDVIDWSTFEYLGNAGLPQIGGFDWRLVFTWHVVPEREQKKRRSEIDVISSPTMAGGLFSVSKKYFEYLGSYDTGMEVWGGENLEFSFRIWQCGGTLEVHPCSHVGHVFPKQAPYSRSKALANSVRAAEVWMDEYKELYYHRNPHARRLKNKGMENYCFDYNPPSEHDVTGQKIILYPCHGMGQNQFFEYTTYNEIRYNTRQPEGCVAVDQGSDHLTMYLCRENGQEVPENQKFIFRADGSLLHQQTQKCVQADRNAQTGNPEPVLKPCSDIEVQRWFFQERS